MRGARPQAVSRRRVAAMAETFRSVGSAGSVRSGAAASLFSRVAGSVRRVHPADGPAADSPSAGGGEGGGGSDDGGGESGSGDGGHCDNEAAPGKAEAKAEAETEAEEGGRGPEVDLEAGRVDTAGGAGDGGGGGGERAELATVMAMLEATEREVLQHRHPMAALSLSRI